MKLSDEHSKKRIKSLEDELANHYAALGGAAGSSAYSASHSAGRPSTPERAAVPGVDFPSAAMIENAAGYGGGGPSQAAPLNTADRGRLDELAERSKGATYGTTANYPTPQAPDTAALDTAYRAPGSYSYEYKDPSAQGAAPGRQSGPMAQELEGIPGVVHQGADGMKRVDTGRLSLANASQTAKHRRELDDLSERLRALEGDPDAELAAAAGERRQ